MFDSILETTKTILAAVGLTLALTAFTTPQPATAGIAALDSCDPETDEYCHDVPYAPAGGSCTGSTCDSQSQICCIKIE
jgi:hypothetical protein